jgi:hypothetical protein
MSDLSVVAGRVRGRVLLTRTPCNIGWGAFKVVSATATSGGSLQLEIEPMEAPVEQFDGGRVERGVFGSRQMFRNRGNPPTVSGNTIRLEDRLARAGYDPAPMVFL